MTRPRSGRLATWCFFGIVVLVRLVVTGDRDLLALNAPYDEYWFIESASRWVWGGRYNQLSFAHLPVYPSWLAALNVLGVPARLGIELGWLGAVGYLAWSLHGLTGRRWVAGGVFVFLAWHPYTIAFFDRALAETLLTVLSCAVLAAAVEIWTCRSASRRDRRRMIATAVFIAGFALAFHTRKEGVALLAPLAVLFVASLMDRPSWWNRPWRYSLGTILLIAPCLATAVSGLAIAGANFFKWGLFERHELAAPGYQRAMAALVSIDVGRQPAQVSVSAAARLHAYAVSPTFALLKPFFEGAPGHELAEHSFASTGARGEIGTGWFYWSLRDAGATVGWHRDARTADRHYAAIADELEQAFADGRLKRRRWNLGPFIDPDIGKWLPAVPSFVRAQLVLLARPDEANLYLPSENASWLQYRTFVDVGGRRTPPRTTSVAGWIVAPPTSEIALGNSTAADAWTVLDGPSRPDVPGAVAFNLRSDAVEAPTQLRLRWPDKREGRIAIDALQEGRMSQIAGDASATVGIDHLQLKARQDRMEEWLAPIVGSIPARAWLTVLGRLYTVLGFGLCILVVCAAALLVPTRSYDARMRALIGLSIVCISTIAARALLFGLLNASSWSGLQARYMLPALPAFACLSGIACIIVQAAIRSKPLNGRVT